MLEEKAHTLTHKIEINKLFRCEKEIGIRHRPIQFENGAHGVRLSAILTAYYNRFELFHSISV